MIGVAAYDPESEMLYVPDAVANVVLQLAVEQGGFVQAGEAAIAPSLGLPPTQVYLLD